MPQPPEPDWWQHLPSWAWALLSPVAGWLGWSKARRQVSADSAARAETDASAEVIELLRAEVRRLSERVEALERREIDLRAELHTAQRLLADAGITQPGPL